MRLEGIAQSKLQHSLTNRFRCKQAGSRIRNAGASCREVWVVEDAERLRTELELLPLGDRERLLKTYVRRIDARQTRSTSGCSILASRGLHIAGRIEEL